MSVYDLINSVWKRERDENNLLPLESNFYEKCRAYTNHLETQASSESDELIAKLFQSRWMRVNYLINDLITIRLQKHFRDIINGIGISKKLPIEEESFRNNLEKQLSNFRDTALGIILSDFSNDLAEQKDDAYKLVLFTQQETIQSVGVDLKTYGPFFEGDIALLPSENFRNYLIRSKVEKISIDDHDY